MPVCQRAACRERYVLHSSQMREQRVGLKHQAHPPLLRGQRNAALGVKPQLLAHGHAPAQTACGQQPGNRPQHTRLAAARGADQSHQLARRAVKRCVQPHWTRVLQ